MSTTTSRTRIDLTPINVARKALEIAQSAAPDFVYSPPDGVIGCINFEPLTGDGSCLFGRAYHALGWRRGDELPDSDSALVFGTVMFVLMRANRVIIRPSVWTQRDHALVRALDFVQKRQDNHERWSNLVPALQEAIAAWEAAA